MTKTGVGNGAEVFLEYTLENALLSKMEVQAIRVSNIRPVEEYSISFTSIGLKYIQYDENGNVLSPNAVGFNTATYTKH